MKYKVLRDRKVNPYPAIWNIEYQSMPENLAIHNAQLTRNFVMEKDGVMTQFYYANDWDEKADVVAENMLNNAPYLTKIFVRQEELGKAFMSFCQSYLETNLNAKKNSELLEIIVEIEKKHNKLCVYNVIPWMLGGDVFQEKVYKLLKDQNSALTDNEWHQLIASAKRTFSSFEEIGLYKTVLASFSKEADQEINDLVQKYFWIPFTYDGPEYFDVAHYEKTISEIKQKLSEEGIRVKINELEAAEEKTKQEQTQLKVKYNLDNETWRLISDIQLLGFMTDRRKELCARAYIIVDKIFDILAKRLEVEKVNFKYLVTDEIKRYIDTPQEIIKLGEERLNRTTLYCAENGKLYCVEKAEAEKILAEFNAEFLAETKEIKGMVASLGQESVIEGTARIVLSYQELNKIEDGDILIATMTTPDYISAMRKAKAIVTNEGGVTCHAAIISRELNIPCIIGTKIATKVLKDGDIVEVDANNGIVKILERAK